MSNDMDNRQGRVDLSGIEGLLKDDFFSAVRHSSVSPDGWRFFVKQKYSSVASFLDFLKRGRVLSLPYSAHIARVFEENYNDEIGHFAGEVRIEYAHETWRLRSLAQFGIGLKDLGRTEPLPAVLEANEIAATLATSEDFFEVVGALLMWESFVVHEMEALIAAFERDLPGLFPKGGYDHKRFPHNMQEYWYSHAQHDVWHFKQIRESLESYIVLHGLKKSERASLQFGADRVLKMKSCLYNPELFEHMRTL